MNLKVISFFLCNVIHTNIVVVALCTIFTIILSFLGKSCNAHMIHASGEYHSYMVSGPNFEFKKIVRNFWHHDTCFLELIQGVFWVQNCKNNGFTEMSVEL